ncbi:GTPase HflX [Alloiococcus otitis]|uniref:GTPase HflX n=2 Tax=Alloiococcus otitis TaxID=1652 RepID=UPI000A02167A
MLKISWRKTILSKTGFEDVVIVGVQKEETDYDFHYSLDELENLVNNAHGRVVGRISQKRDSLDQKTFVGKGKLKEIKDLVEAKDATCLIFNQELSPSHVRNIQDFINVKVLDRIQVILDIFAMRAQSKAGRLQVELAQLNYLLPRLAGQGENLSRLGGGIGTRGPGETKLETDRRHIQKQISDIKKELVKLADHRKRSRQKRQESQIVQIGLIGYTNAGKSTLLNKLTGSQSLEKDILFATLDPITRQLTLPSGLQVTLTDTVGFIKDLPTQLIESFKSTLEESRQADILLHLVDASSPNRVSQEDTVVALLEDLDMEDIPRLTVYNKKDKLDQAFTPLAFPNLLISALDDQDITYLKSSIENFLMDQIMATYQVDLPASRGDIYSALQQGTIVKKEKFDKTNQSYKIEGYAKKDSYWQSLLEEGVDG